MQMPAIALRHTLFYVAFSIDLLISDVIGHTCRTETVMTFLLTLPKCSKAQVSGPALIYEHCGHKIPDDEQHSFRFTYLGFIFLFVPTLSKIFPCDWLMQSQVGGFEDWDWSDRWTVSGDPALLILFGGKWSNCGPGCAGVHTLWIR